MARAIDKNAFVRFLPPNPPNSRRFAQNHPKMTQLPSQGGACRRCAAAYVALEG